MTELSIIIATLKPREQIVCLRDLARQEFKDYEVIIRDDDRVTVARNEGIKRAQADKLVFLDDDSRPTEGYLNRVSTMLDEEAVVAGKIVHPRTDVIKEFTGHYAPAESAKYITRFWGCNMAARREVFDTVGGWDENITWGHEEKELAERVLHEYPIYYDPELTVYHSYADSVRDYWKKQYQLETQTPYLWEKSEMPAQRQWLEIIRLGINPINYIRLTPRQTVVQAGGELARTAGRIRGMLKKLDDQLL
ncbi:glycosyltransferase family 2 protein [Salinigranum halophilum]|uniref:glycosyltransferase family 2 protein n=1 Tax=Salinigranum halophilum TaxID=2565931 RepID=UPI0010A86492|nr:glycosyltransferase [Salinigranum halophilum]